jgi:hypothetical protein
MPRGLTCASVTTRTRLVWALRHHASSTLLDCPRGWSGLDDPCPFS